MNTHPPFPYRFFLITLGWSWLIWIPLILVGGSSTWAIPISMAAAFGPGVGAIVSMRTLEGKGTVNRYLKSLLDFRLGWRVWVLGPVLLTIVSVAAWFVPELFGQTRLESLLPSPWVLPVYFLIMVLLGGGQEELGWRGYVLDHLEARLGTWWGNLVLGLVWGIWHIPLFFISGLSQSYTPFAAFLLLTIGYSWLFAWARERSGKKPLSGMVMHGWANAIFPLFPALVMTAGASQIRYWLWASLILALGLAVQFFRSGSRSGTRRNDPGEGPSAR